MGHAPHDMQQPFGVPRGDPAAGASGIGSQVSENELNDRRNYSRRYA